MYKEEKCIYCVDGFYFPCQQCYCASSSIMNLRSNYEKKWRTYEGAWFYIKYPEDFCAIGSIKSPYVKGKYESATFISPDGTVEFYVYADSDVPATDIEINTKNEILVAHKQWEEHITPGLTNIVQWYTINSKDNSYSRSYEDQYWAIGPHHFIMGLKYKDISCLRKYYKEYLIFKKSLTWIGPE